jgi:methylglutamate dehydrogenase subunit D
MSEHRQLPLRDVAKPGRFGADRGAPGVVLEIVHPVTLVSVIARKGKAKAVADGLKALKGAQATWAGADQYYVEGIAASELKKKLGAAASVIDQSHGRVVIRMSGARVRDVLAKGTPVDVHAGAFPVGKSAMTQMAHVGVHLTRTGQDEFVLSVFRGFSESFWEWLTTSAAEFGYAVT